MTKVSQSRRLSCWVDGPRLSGIKRAIGVSKRLDQLHVTARLDTCFVKCTIPCRSYLLDLGPSTREYCRTSSRDVKIRTRCLVGVFQYFQARPAGQYIRKSRGRKGADGGESVV